MRGGRHARAPGSGSEPHAQGGTRQVRDGECVAAPEQPAVAVASRRADRRRPRGPADAARGRLECLLVVAGDVRRKPEIQVDPTAAVEARAAARRDEVAVAERLVEAPGTQETGHAHELCLEHRVVHEPAPREIVLDAGERVAHAEAVPVRAGEAERVRLPRRRGREVVPAIVRVARQPERDGGQPVADAAAARRAVQVVAELEEQLARRPAAQRRDEGVVEADVLHDLDRELVHERRRDRVADGAERSEAVDARKQVVRRARRRMVQEVGGEAVVVERDRLQRDEALLEARTVPVLAVALDVEPVPARSQREQADHLRRRASVMLRTIRRSLCVALVKLLLLPVVVHEPVVLRRLGRGRAGPGSDEQGKRPATEKGPARAHRPCEPAGCSVRAIGPRERRPGG